MTAHSFEIWKTVADMGDGFIMQEKYIIEVNGGTVDDCRPATELEDMGLSEIGAVARSGTNPHTGEEVTITPDRRIIHIKEMNNVEVSPRAMEKIEDNQNP